MPKMRKSKKKPPLYPHNLVLWMTTEQRSQLDKLKEACGFKTRRELFVALADAAAKKDKEDLYGIACRDMPTFGQRGQDGVEQVRAKIDKATMKHLQTIRGRYRNAGAVLIGLAQKLLATDEE